MKCQRSVTQAIIFEALQYREEVELVKPVFRRVVVLKSVLLAGGFGNKKGYYEWYCP